jgi:LuxR family maltose regulon positive regulatory protein
VLRGFAARFAGRLDEALEINRAVLTELPADEAFTRGLVIYNQARLHMVFGEMQPAAQLLHEASKLNQRAGTLYLVLTGLGQSATVSAQLEGVYRARQKLDAALAFAEQQYLTGLPAFSAVLYHLGSVALLADRLDEAHAGATRAVELASASNFPEGHANGLLILARVAAARRRFDEADALLIELAALAHNRNVVLLDTTVALEQKRLALLREQCGAGPPLARFTPATNGTRWTILRETELMLCLHQTLRVQDYDAAAQLADTLRRESEPRGRGVALCVALLADALVPAHDDRWSALDLALTMAATRGYARPLLDHGELLRPVLQAALAHPMSTEARAHARFLLERLDRTTCSAAALPLSKLMEPLTAREEQVLQYLGAKLSNKGIARSMYVSAETVKTHLKHLYWKLGAGNRKEALDRARELGLVR